MRRIVYSPKAYVYVQTDNGVYNLSDLVVSGSVSRKVNQVSSAEVTFQNPYRQFTSPGNPTFRPMDKITIFLQRLPGLPCHAFTGYLDTTPYYQMYPGTCTIKASCTLKRLQYTWFDPGVPFMIKFLDRYGWRIQGDGSIGNSPFDDNATVADQEQSESMSDLLFAVLKHIAGIDKGQILIEDLPEELLNRIGKIYDILKDETEENAKQYKEWLKAFLGDITLGSGGSAGGGPANGIKLSSLTAEQNKVLDMLMTVADRMKVPEKFRISAIETGIVESNLRNLSYGDADSKGWRQERVSIYGESATDVEASAHRYYKECKQFDHGQSAGELSADVQRPAAQYRGRYGEHEAEAKQLLKDYEAKRGKDDISKDDATSDTTQEGSKSTKDKKDKDKGAKDTSSGETTRYDAIVAEANRLSKLANAGLRYNNARPPSDTSGNDCSSGQCLLLKAAGYKVAGWPATNTIKEFMKPGKDPTGRVTWWNSDRSNTAGNTVHIWAEIDGRPWSTGGDRGNHWQDDYYGKNDKSKFDPFHVNGLDEPHDIPADGDTNSGGGGGDAEGSLGYDDALVIAKTASVFTSLEFPGAVNTAESTLLTGDRSLMNDQPLLPFIEQLCKGTLRSFQSLPNGDFYAWFPDYFGAMGTAPYWEIDDIEVIQGGIELSDDALVTHSYVVGATLPDQGIDLSRKLQTRGIVTLLNAGNADFLNIDPGEVKKKWEENKRASEKAARHATKKAKNGKKDDKAKAEQPEPFLGDYDAVMKFLGRYGARPYVEDAPFIRSHAFETFYAFQNFMLAWSRQFLTTFTFTFMPEIYPGGLVEFKDHGIQMYVDEVHHSWDYTSGFTTQANLSAPSSTGTDSAKSAISTGMVRGGHA